jgi:hypothetical protein
MSFAEGVRVGYLGEALAGTLGEGPGRDPGRGPWANGLALPWACLGLPGLSPLGVWAQHRLRGVRVRCTGQRRSSR